MTVDVLLEAAKKLPATDRIRLVEQVWNSVAAEDTPIELSADQEAELNRRLDRLEQHGPTGTPWETLKAELRGRAGR